MRIFVFVEFEKTPLACMAIGDHSVEVPYNKPFRGGLCEQRGN